jgi:hypothetical protein
MDEADLNILHKPETDETIDGLILTSEELVLIRRRRARQSFELGFYAGLSAAEQKLLSLADECAGGSGEGSTADTFRLAAKSLTNVKLTKTS